MKPRFAGPGLGLLGVVLSLCGMSLLGVIVFRQMSSTAAPPDKKWGVHLGNVGDEVWHENFLSRIDGDREGGMWPTVVVV